MVGVPTEIRTGHIPVRTRKFTTRSTGSMQGLLKPRVFFS